MPKKPKLLFDALIRLGEYKSQSEIALAVKSEQNIISQAFTWLTKNNFVDFINIELAGTNSKQNRKYYVKDRNLLAFYKMRYRIK